MGPVGKLTQLVFECADPVALARFWQAILDLDAPTCDGERVTLQWEPVGRLSFHRVEDYVPPPWPGRYGEQRSHVDLLVDDLDSAGERVLAQGAAALSPVIDPGPRGWRVFADPAGHPFCLVSSAE